MVRRPGAAGHHPVEYPTPISRCSGEELTSGGSLTALSPCTGAGAPPMRRRFVAGAEIKKGSAGSIHRQGTIPETASPSHGTGARRG